MKPRKYHVYQKGFLIGTLSLLPDHVKRLESRGFILKPVESAKKNVRKVARVKKARNPGGLVKIYDKITRIEGTKGKNSAYPGQRFFHNFKRPYPSMYGTPDRKTLVIK